MRRGRGRGNLRSAPRDLSEFAMSQEVERIVEEGRHDAERLHGAMSRERARQQRNMQQRLEERRAQRRSKTDE